jgi:antitoxin (DNA-binding transcriptional repressor) of toxin-antitoxin stability system
MADDSPHDKPAVARIPLAVARADLAALIDRLAMGDERFIIEKGGEAVAVLIGIDEFEDYLELNDPEVNKAIAESREEYLAGKSRPAEELLRELREDEERERRSEESVR